MKPHSRFRLARRALLFWCLFVGLGAVLGGVCMLLRPDGSILQMQSLLPYFQVLPFARVLFQDYRFPGVALLLVNGLTNLTAAGLLFAKKPLGVVLGGVFGCTLMAWICIQFVIFPMNFMSTIYFIFGLAQALTGYAAWVFYRQERFRAEQSDYPRIGTDPRTLVVYFSRMGYCRRLALEEAEKTGGDLYPLCAAEPTAGTLGFWWCGRYAMHRWDMPIQPVSVDLPAYQRVVICSPIWAFALACPVRTFCRQAGGRVKAADYILVHHMHGRFDNAAREMDSLLGLTHGSLRSYRCHAGCIQAQ